MPQTHCCATGRLRKGCHHKTRSPHATSPSTKQAREEAGADTASEPLRLQGAATGRRSMLEAKLLHCVRPVSCSTQRPQCVRPVSNLNEDRFLRLTEAQVRSRYPDLFVASLEAIRKDEPNNEHQNPKPGTFTQGKKSKYVTRRERSCPPSRCQ